MSAKKGKKKPHALEPHVSRFEQVILYETASTYYLIGFDDKETHFRILKIDRRTEKPSSLEEILREDPIVYNKEELKEMLMMISEGNRAAG